MANDDITNDIIMVAIKSTSEECEIIRDDGQFFRAIAEVLWIDEEDVKEVVIVNNKIKIVENYNDKSRSD